LQFINTQKQQRRWNKKDEEANSRD
jgi:hypothetical protein